MNRKKLLTILLTVLIIVSSNAQTWNSSNTGYDFRLRAIEFPDAQNQVGYAGGQDANEGLMLKTTDGGNSWTELWLQVDYMVEDMCFVDINTGYACGWNNYIARTEDGGENWDMLSPGAAYINYFTSIAFKDANHGVVTGMSFTGGGIKVYYTSDGGVTWTLGSGLAALPSKIVYTGDDTYFLVASGVIQKSVNGGQSWSTVYSTGGNTLFGIDFFNSMTGIAGGENGWIYKTYDGGVTWQSQQIAGGLPSIHDFAWNSQNQVYACGTSEIIYKSIDGGITWNNDFPAGSGSQDLYEILFIMDGTIYSCGTHGWFYEKAAPATALFTQNTAILCNGSSVQFTDQSYGSPTSWNWIFEGGTPSTSTLQNPVVAYSTPGVYDVSLSVSNSFSSNILAKSDLITVEAPVSATTTQPTGATEICGSFNYSYSTSAVAGATNYIWQIEPASAGTISGAGLTGSLVASNTWNGPFTIKVAGANTCGTGQFSPDLNCTLFHQPNIYSLFSGGGYCADQPGYEIKLEDSDLGVNYQLFKNGNATGTPVAGTGTTLSFGYQTIGDYTVNATNQSCFAIMPGVSSVYIIDPPSAATQPVGPVSSCAGTQSTYTASLPLNGFTLLWIVSPASAGTVTQPTTTTATVTWNEAYSGTAEISVQGQNECGNGPSSPPLQVSVDALPQPLVTGLSNVCLGTDVDYETSENTGSSYLWYVTGGTIISGSGTSSVKVNWNTSGTGTLQVEEISAQNCTGTSTMFSVAVDPCVGIDEPAINGFLSVYPNPVLNYINVKLSEKARPNSQLRFVDPAGREVYTILVNNSDNLIEGIDISGLSAGYYLLQLMNSNTVVSQIKFIKY